MAVTVDDGGEDQESTSSEKIEVETYVHVDEPRAKRPRGVETAFASIDAFAEDRSSTPESLKLS